MRLLFFVQMLDPDDANLGFIVQWARALSREVDELVVVSLETRSFDIGENVRVISLGKEDRASKPVQTLRLASHLGREILGGKVDAVLAHMAPVYSVISAPFAFVGRVPIFTWYTHRHVPAMLRLAEKCSRLCFTASDASFRLASLKKRVMGHGIDMERFSRRPNLVEGREGPLRLLSASRLSPVKRVDVLLEALTGLEGDWTLHLAGGVPLDSQRPYEGRVLELARSFGGRVRVHGAVPHGDMPRLLGQADAFINLSDTGSLDKGVLEALAVGCTVLTGNEAFRDLLAGTLERTFLEDVSVESVRARLRSLMECARSVLQEDQDLLSERVRREHSLQRLASRLVGEMEGSIGS